MNTNIENSISEMVGRFGPISLAEMDSVKLMRRTDTKFVMPVYLLPHLLECSLPDYRIVEIKGERAQPYETTYFDTPNYEMYSLHHNGKLNRYKIRLRRYVVSDLNFLEVKRKNNKGETIKTRINPVEPADVLTSNEGSLFLKKNTPYTNGDLEPVLGNKFVRLTLVNNGLNERITLDYNLEFDDLKYEKHRSAGGLCIAEVKRSRDSAPSTFVKILAEMRLNPHGFSKYCLGVAMLNPDVKNNLFLKRIRMVEKFERQTADFLA